MIRLYEAMQIWLGNQISVDILKDVQARINALSMSEWVKMQKEAPSLLSSMSSPKDNYADHYMIEMIGNLAIVSVKGLLLDIDLPLRAWGLNITTYGEIQQALATVARDDSVEQVMMLYDTPGGGLSNLDRTSQMLSKLSERKPVYTHASGTMASAGYWLGSNAKKIVCERTSEVGSIGVYVIMHSIAKAVAEDNIEVKIVRAGEFKALGHPLEPLSEKAIAERQASVDQTYSLFLDHTSQARGQPKEAFRKRSAEGRVFMGQDAVQANLVDEVMLFDDFVNQLLQSGNKSKGRSSGSPSSKPKLSGPDMNKKLLAALKKLGISLTAEQQSILASGGSFKDLGLPAEQVAELEAVEAEAPEEPAAQTVPETTPTTPTTPTQATTPTPGSDMLALTNKMLELQSSLTQEQGKAAAAANEITSLKATLATLQGQITSLSNIAINSIERYASGMRVKCMGLETLSVNDLVAKHTELKTSFEAMYPTGQKSKTSETVPTEGRKVNDAKHSATLAATSITPSKSR